MAHTFIVRTPEAATGPYTSRELRKLAADGDLARDHYVKRADQEQWHKAGIIKGVFIKASPPKGQTTSAAPRAKPPESVVAVNPGEPEAGKSQITAPQSSKPVTLGIPADQPVQRREIPLPHGTAGLIQSALAMASLLLGNAAIGVCWIPSIGVVGIVAAGLGLLMAAAALSMTMTRQCPEESFQS